MLDNFFPQIFHYAGELEKRGNVINHLWNCILEANSVSTWWCNGPPFAQCSCCGKVPVHVHLQTDLDFYF